MRFIIALSLAVAAASGAEARAPNISDTTGWLSRVAEASVAAKACGYEINANKVMGEMLATYDSMDSFTGEFFGDQLDKQEAALRRDRTGFCRRAWDKFGATGSDIKSLLLPGR